MPRRTVDLINWQKGDGAPLDVTVEIPTSMTWCQVYGNDSWDFTITVEEVGNTTLTLLGRPLVTNEDLVRVCPYILWANWVHRLKICGEMIQIEIAEELAIEFLAKWYFSQEEEYLPTTFTEVQWKQMLAQALSPNTERKLLVKNEWGNLVPYRRRTSFFLNDVLHHFHPSKLSVRAR